jgi:hypothetical protein
VVVPTTASCITSACSCRGGSTSPIATARRPTSRRGEVSNIQPGHDAWVVGDEPAVGVEFDSKLAATFAQG